MREATINSYEATFILGETASPELAKAKTGEISKLIESFGGAVSKDEQWGRRDLAYPILRNRSGFYTTIWFTLPTNQVSALERALRFDEAVIRSLVTKAYTTAQPGSLYPVAEEEKPARGRKTAEEAVTAEEDLRRHTATNKKKQATSEEADELSEEERLKQIDDVVGELLKEAGEESGTN